MSVLTKIKKLTKQLYPTGRAFKMPTGGVFDKLVDGLNESEARAWSDANAILNSILPDNNNFTADDATDWERRLGLITSSGVSLADRKASILRKYNHPGDIKARQHYLFLQRQLRAAGFDVYVHENRFAYGDGSYYTVSPLDLDPSWPIVSIQHSQFVQHGDIQHGGSLGRKVVNFIQDEQDDPFEIGNSFRFTFFVGGAYLGDYANVPIARKNEFRQIILMTKPVQTVGFLFINFV